MWYHSNNEIFGNHTCNPISIIKHAIKTNHIMILYNKQIIKDNNAVTNH